MTHNHGCESKNPTNLPLVFKRVNCDLFDGRNEIYSRVFVKLIGMILILRETTELWDSECYIMRTFMIT
jgi:hypothetical protein